MQNLISLAENYQFSELALRQAINNEISSVRSMEETVISKIITSLNSAANMDGVKDIVNTLADHREQMGESGFRLDTATRKVALKIKRVLAFL